ncbi:hypothetical protein NMY22_g6154 [Coprinellus aureogranulatus]|nr:hypothetical protein NMY22_g6154 [Coprinellus aureogranulatus]
MELSKVLVKRALQARIRNAADITDTLVGRKNGTSRSVSPYHNPRSGASVLAANIASRGAQLDQAELLAIIRTLLAACTRLENEVLREQRSIDEEIRLLQEDLAGFRRDMGLQPREEARDTVSGENEVEVVESVTPRAQSSRPRGD